MLHELSDIPRAAQWLGMFVKRNKIELFLPFMLENHINIISSLNILPQFSLHLSELKHGKRLEMFVDYEIHFPIKS